MGTGLLTLKGTKKYIKNYNIQKYYFLAGFGLEGLWAPWAPWGPQGPEPFQAETCQKI